MGHRKTHKYLKKVRKSKSFRKSRKSRHSKQKNRRVSKKRKSHKAHKSRKLQKGGFGLGANPLVDNAWSAIDPGYYYSPSKFGVGVGGTNPYYGMSAPSPQHGGSWLPNAILEPIRHGTNFFEDRINQYKGQRLNPSPSPSNQYMQPHAPPGPPISGVLNHPH